jgi:RNA polymerase sigma-32 factor
MLKQNELDDRYLKQISSYPRITLEREAELSRIIQNSKRRAKVEKAVEEMVNGNLRLVVHCAKEFSRYLTVPGCAVTTMDLIAEGNVALIKAARNFNSDYKKDGHGARKRGRMRFSAYACICIKRAMRRALQSGRLIHIPEHHFRYWRRIHELQDEHGPEMADTELQESLGIGSSKLAILKKGLSARASMLEDLPGAEDALNWAERIPDRRVRGPDHEAGLKDLRAYLVNEMKRLPQRTREMISMVFLAEYRPTLGHVAERYGVSSERCRQICAAGLKALRTQIEASSIPVGL